MHTTRTLFIAAAALAAALALPGLAGAQPASGSTCASGVQPLTTRSTDAVVLIGAGPFLSPFSQFGTTIPGGETITTTENVAGVQGLTRTVVSSGLSLEGFGSATVSLGVPEYLLQAYGGNITAIERDLAAGYLRCRSS